MKLKFGYKCDDTYYVDAENNDVLNKVTRKLKNNKNFLEMTLSCEMLEQKLNEFITEGVGVPTHEVDGRLRTCHIYHEDQQISISGELTFTKTTGEYSIVESFYGEGFVDWFTSLLISNSCFLKVNDRAKRDLQFSMTVVPKSGTIQCHAVLEE
jgi:hypothetical protein